MAGAGVDGAQGQSRGKRPPTTTRILLCGGIDGPVNELVKTADFKRWLREQGAAFTESPYDATHIVSRSPRCSSRFLASVVNNDTFVSPEWLSSSYAARTFLPETDYPIKGGNFGDPQLTTMKALAERREQTPAMRKMQYVLTRKSVWAPVEFQKDWQPQHVVMALGGSMHTGVSARLRRFIDTFAGHCTRLMLCFQCHHSMPRSWRSLI